MVLLPGGLLQCFLEISDIVEVGVAYRIYAIHRFLGSRAEHRHIINRASHVRRTRGEILDVVEYGAVVVTETRANVSPLWVIDQFRGGLSVHIL